MDTLSTQEHGVATILKELSDIKANLAVNSNETANIKGNIADIKSDIKEIKNDFVNRREFNEATKDLNDKISEVKKWGSLVGAAIVLAIIAAVMGQILK